MPTQRKPKTRRLKRRTVRRSQAVVSRTSPVPDIFKTQLHYTDLVTINYALALAYKQYRANSIFDPDYTGAGHQPMGHDQLALLYNKYRVTGLKYEVIFSNTSPVYQGEVIVQFRPNLTLSATFDDAMESPYRTYKVLGAETSGPVTLRGTVALDKVYGVSRKYFLNDDVFQANIGANPSSTIAMNVYAQNQTTGTALTVLARVNLVYMVEFYERKVLGQS